MKPKIIIHPSLTITEDGINELGLGLIDRLKERFPFSDEQLCSDESYLEDLQMSYHYEAYKRYEWAIRAISGSLMSNILDLPDKEVALMIWGSGEVHFVSQYLSLRKDAYKKVIFDRHHDDVGLNELAMIGSIPSRAGRWIDDERKSNSNFSDFCIIRNSNSCDYIDEDIHLSIDLDVVSGFPAKYNWQHDEKKIDKLGMSLEYLIESLDRILSKNRLRRFDIGGLHTPTPDEIKHYSDPRIKNPTDPKSSKFAVKCYSAVLDVVYQHLKP